MTRRHTLNILCVCEEENYFQIVSGCEKIYDIFVVAFLLRFMKKKHTEDGFSTIKYDPIATVFDAILRVTI